MQPNLKITLKERIDWWRTKCLKQEKHGSFNEDLYYRFCVLTYQLKNKNNHEAKIQ